MQEQEVGDLIDILRKRAEIEKKYSKELDNLAKHARGKHKVNYNCIIKQQILIITYVVFLELGHSQGHKVRRDTLIIFLIKNVSVQYFGLI